MNLRANGPDERDISNVLATREPPLPAITEGSLFAQIEDKKLAQSIISLRQNYDDLTAENITLLSGMTGEYIRRGAEKYLYFSPVHYDPETQNWLWGGQKAYENAILEGFKLDSETKLMEVESDNEVEGFIYRLNRRQLARMDDIYQSGIRSKAYITRTTSKDSKSAISEVCIHLKDKKLQAEETKA